MVPGVTAAIGRASLLTRSCVLGPREGGRAARFFVSHGVACGIAPCGSACWKSHGWLSRCCLQEEMVRVRPAYCVRLLCVRLPDRGDHTGGPGCVLRCCAVGIVCWAAWVLFNAGCLNNRHRPDRETPRKKNNGGATLQCGSNKQDGWWGSK